MQVHTVHVDQIGFDPEDPKDAYPGWTVQLRSVRYEFNKPTWVSANPDRDGRELGPITQLEPFDDGRELAEVSVTRFPDRRLPTGGSTSPEYPEIVFAEHAEGDVHRVPDRITYQEEWTMTRGTVYGLVFPPEFVADAMTVLQQADGEKTDLEDVLSKQRTNDDKLFYYFVCDTDGVIDIDTTLIHDPTEWEMEMSGADTQEWDSVRDMIGRRAPSSNTWLLLLELRKIFGLP